MNYIQLKGGLIKSYWFDDEFYNKNKKIVDELSNIFDEIYKNDCCVFGATETNKNNIELKNKIVNILKIFFDLGIQIENGFTDEDYLNFKEIEDYILNYGG